MGSPMRVTPNNQEAQRSTRRKPEPVGSSEQAGVHDLDTLIEWIRQCVARIDMDGLAAGDRLPASVTAALVPGTPGTVGLPQLSDCGGDLATWRRAWDDLRLRLEAHQKRLARQADAPDDDSLMLLPVEHDLLAAIEARRK
jgi:hypothetical protein